jgi:hypothetical protein
VMQFVERTNELHCVEELAEALLKTLSSYGLSATIEISDDDGKSSHYSSYGNVSPIVIELFALLKTKGRIYSFAPRMMINYSRISLLLLNMPQGDEDKMGRLRDHLCFIGSSAEQCLNAILTANELTTQKRTVKETFTLVKNKLEDLVLVINESHEMNELIFRELQEQFENTIPSMGLEEDQEQYIYKSLDKSIEKSFAREDLLMNIKVTFGEIEEELDSLLVDS